MNHSEHAGPTAILVEVGTGQSGQAPVANRVSWRTHQRAATTPAAPVSSTPSKTRKWKKVGLGLVAIVVCVALAVALNIQCKRNSPTFRNPGHGGQPRDDKDDPVPQTRLVLHAHPRL